MHLPINIDNILRGKTVEWQRLEFKQGWNPEKVLHTMCAFANDVHNLGGGYIFVGIEEQNGLPVLPPIGLDKKQIDKIQKELVEMEHHDIQPQYNSISVPYTVDGRDFLVIWVPGGQSRPYKAKVSMGQKTKEFAYFLRRNSVTKKATKLDEQELLKLSATVPFDDRINYQASIDDLDYGLIKEFLYEINSELKNELNDIDFEALCQRMRIINGPKEMRHPVNVGLMFFAKNPEQFFPYAQIDVVHFPEGADADVFSEKIFKGPLWKSLKSALAYISTTVIKEYVIKSPHKAEADRIYNYPYTAIEESLVNAVYHRGYDIREPIEVRILPEEIFIKSFPGPDISINLENLKKGQGASQRYTNRRIGDFLKELDLTEGRGTGIPKILRSLKSNGSLIPTFESNEERTYFVTAIPIHPKVAELEKKIEKAIDQPGGKSNDLLILEILLKCEASKGELAERLGLEKNSGHMKRLVKKLFDSDLIRYTIPSNHQSRSQKYKITRKGKKVILGLIDL